MDKKLVSLIGVWFAAVAVAAILYNAQLIGVPAPSGDDDKVYPKADNDYLMATATIGGTYYPVGVAIATLIRIKLIENDNISMSAINSAGSGENVGLLMSGEVQFAILQGLFGYNAWTGQAGLPAEEVHGTLRSMTMLWENVEQFVCGRDDMPERLPIRCR